ncbi:MAG TPA: nucleotidyltransferase domain-containing protein [archaeon]|nr:nucleotidyltransferase domain-containing protein [archaeon]
MDNNLNCSVIMNICSVLLDGNFMDIILSLVDSKSKKTLMSKIFGHRNHDFTVSELGRLADLPKSTVSTITTDWEKTGLIKSVIQGRNKIISLNKKFYLLPELERIFEKTRDFQKPLVDALLSLPSLKKKGVKAVVLFGSRTRNDFTHASDLDVLIAAEDKSDDVVESIFEDFGKASEKTGVRFSPIIMQKKDIKTRWKEQDLFIKNVLNKGKILKGGKWIEHIQTAP